MTSIETENKNDSTHNDDLQPRTRTDNEIAERTNLLIDQYILSSQQRNDLTIYTNIKIPEENSMYDA